MAKEEELDEEKKGGDEQGAVSETILEKSRDPDEAKDAESSIKHFVRDQVQQFNDKMDSAIDGLEAFLLQQAQEDQQLFSSRGYFDELGDMFQAQLFDIAGGKGTPVMDTIASEVDFTVSFAEHSVFQTSIFLNEMRRGVRDACWYVRDATASILSNQWADLLDLATGGSLDFIPALYQMGLPGEKFNPKDLTASLTSHAEAFKKSRQQPKEEVAEKANEKPVDDEKKMEAEEEADQVDQTVLDETKKQSQVAMA